MISCINKDWWWWWCYCKQTAQFVVLEAFIFEVRIKIYRQHLLECVSLWIFTDLTFFPGGGGGEWGGRPGFFNFFCPLTFDILLRMTLTIDDGAFKLTQNLIYLLYFCFSASFFNFFCPLTFDILLRMTLTIDDGAFKLTQNLIYLLYFCFSANIWNIFSGGSRALSLKVE